MAFPPIKSIEGHINIPSSKSEAQRALLIAAISEHPIKIYLQEPSDDVLAVTDLLSAIGFGIRMDDHNVEIYFFPTKQRKLTISARESGFALRSLSSVAMHWTDQLILTGENTLQRRNFNELINHLSMIGLEVQQTEEKLPLQISGHLTSGNFSFSASDSSQSISGILIALSKLTTDSKISLEKIVSFPYVQLTIDILRKFGYSIEQNGQDIHIKGNSSKGVTKFEVGGDWSSAAVWIAAAALKGEIRLSGLSLQSSQSDRCIIDIIKKSGAHVFPTDKDIRVTKTLEKPKPIDVDLTDCPDLFPVLAIYSCGINGMSTFRSINRLKNKESNRLEAICQMLRVFEVAFVIENEILYIYGEGFIKGGFVDIYEDHRLVMAAALASCISEYPIEINNEKVIGKSYKNFISHWKSCSTF